MKSLNFTLPVTTTVKKLADKAVATDAKFGEEMGGK